jgi:hypothetical protein
MAEARVIGERNIGGLRAARGFTICTRLQRYSVLLKRYCYPLNQYIVTNTKLSIDTMVKAASEFPHN